MTTGLGEVILYEAPGGEVRLDVRLERDTVWLALNQMIDLFGRDKSVISRHLRNVFQAGELERSAVVAKNATTAADGKVYQVEYFNLDAIIAVGYRVNSLRGTQFRIWATQTLKEHLVRGYTLHRQRFEQNARELEAALTLVRKTAAGEALTTDQGRGLVDIIARYTQTFLLLQRYDEGLLVEPTGVAGGLLLTVEEAHAAIGRLKHELVGRGEATDLFGREREDGLASLLLERVFLLERLPAWHSNRLSRLVKRPKLHIGDTGVACALLGVDAAGLGADRQLLGAMLETFVLQELRRQASWRTTPTGFFHFRDRDDFEVDIVLEQGPGAIAGVEVKAAASVNPGDFRGLRKLRDLAGKRFTAGAVLYDGGATIRFEENLFAVPVRRLWGPE